MHDPRIAAFSPPPSSSSSSSTVTGTAASSRLTAETASTHNPDANAPTTTTPLRPPTSALDRVKDEEVSGAVKEYREFLRNKQVEAELKLNSLAEDLEMRIAETRVELAVIENTVALTLRPDVRKVMDNMMKELQEIKEMLRETNDDAASELVA